MPKVFETYTAKESNQENTFSDESRYLANPGMENRIYNIPKDKIKQSLWKKIRTNITVYIVVALLFLLLIIVPVFFNGSRDAKTYIALLAVWGVTVVIMIAAVFPIIRRWRKDVRSIPEKVVVTASAVFFDGISFQFHEIERLSMTGKESRDGRRKIEIKRNGEKIIYSLGLVDKHFELFPEYVDLYRDLKKHLGNKFVHESI